MRTKEEQGKSAIPQIANSASARYSARRSWGGKRHGIREFGRYEADFA
jgi:hypothetical protein